MPTQHLSKRPYQPPITSFFHPSSDSPYGPALHQQPYQHVDEETQSSLLSLGMRIRKVVPEGYKTHKTLSGPSTHQVSSRKPLQSHPRSVSSALSSTTRELQPLCGLFKIGGLSAPQELGTADEYDMALQIFEEEGGQWQGTSSQESNFSVRSEGDVKSLDSAVLFGGSVSGATESHSRSGWGKRRLDAYVESEEEADDEAETDLPSFLMASPGKAFPGRVFARPRRRAASNLRESMSAFSMRDPVVESGGFDFEEASFLRGQGDLEGEIEMRL